MYVHHTACSGRFFVVSSLLASLTKLETVPTVKQRSTLSSTLNPGCATTWVGELWPTNRISSPSHSVNSVLLELGAVCLFVCCLWLVLSMKYQRDRVEWLSQRHYGPQLIKYLPNLPWIEKVCWPLFSGSKNKWSIAIVYNIDKSQKMKYWVKAGRHVENAKAHGLNLW